MQDNSSFLPLLRIGTPITALLLAGCASLAGGIASGPAQNLGQGAGTLLFAAGDIADCRRAAPADTGAARTAALIRAGLAEDDTAVVLALGDIAYQTGSSAEFADCYRPTWGQFRQRTVPAPGNHEYYSAGAQGYYDYFGALAGPDRRGYFSREVGSWHVVSLNSNLKALPAQQAQLAWLTEDLAQLRRRSPGACVLAFWHHPLYSSGGHGNNPQMHSAWQALQAAHADVVLSAHDHGYERFAPQDDAANLDVRKGIRAFVVGTGGASLTPFRTTQPHSLAQENVTHGVLRMRLRADGYDWAFLAVDGSPARDVGTARCHGS
jgi:hypothetical protein